MLNQIRKQTKRVLTPIARAFLRINLSPNLITVLGLIFSFIYFFTMMKLNVVIAILFLILSSLMDAIDGEVARLSNKVSKFGSFLDSTLDRIEDIIYITGFIFIGFPSYLIALGVGLSLVISYIRAKAESLGLKMEGRGIIERGERIIFVLLILLIYLILGEVASLYLFYLFLVLTLITVIQRFYVVYSALKS